MSDLTEKEQEIYDRQLRLWGVKTQQALQSHILYVRNITGVTCEILKNLVLAGIGKVLICDETLVSNRELSSNFLLDKSHIGKKRGESCLPALRELNPMVEVTIVKETPQDYNTLLISGVGYEQVLSFSKSAHGKNFIWVDTLGLQGFAFFDFQSVEFRIKRIVERKDKPNLSVSRIYKTTYSRLEDSCKNIWKNDKLSDSFTALHISLMCNATTAAEALQQVNVNSKEVDLEYLQTVLNQKNIGNIGPVCAIVGGVVSQEIIKSCSRDNFPISNYFVYDGCGNGAGFIENINTTTVLIAENKKEIEDT